MGIGGRMPREEEEDGTGRRVEDDAVGTGGTGLSNRTTIAVMSLEGGRIQRGRSALAMQSSPFRDLPRHRWDMRAGTIQAPDPT